MLQAESGTDPGVDLEAMRERVEIQRALQTGDVQKAIDMVNDLNPEVRLV
jgi:glucose-induced degradation protein 8